MTLSRFTSCSGLLQLSVEWGYGKSMKRYHEAVSFLQMPKVRQSESPPSKLRSSTHESSRITQIFRKYRGRERKKKIQNGSYSQPHWRIQLFIGRSRRSIPSLSQDFVRIGVAVAPGEKKNLNILLNHLLYPYVRSADCKSFLHGHLRCVYTM